MRERVWKLATGCHQQGFIKSTAQTRLFIAARILKFWEIEAR